MVNINEGIPTLTIKTLFIKPASKPTARQIKKAKYMLFVWLNTNENTQAQNPIIEGKERSISPKITTGVNDIAKIAEKGIVDIKA
jgi:hypothetical protein